MDYNRRKLRDWLNQYKACESELRTIELEWAAIEQTIGAPSAIAYDRDVVQTSQSGDGLHKTYEELERQKGKLIKRRETAISKMVQILERINTLENIDYQGLLVRCYIYHMTLEQASESMGYSYSNICKMHTKALECLLSNDKRSVIQ